MVPKYRFSSNFYSKLMGLLGTNVEKCKKSIVGVSSNVSLKITGGAQHKVKLRPEFAATLHEEKFRY